MSSNSIITGYCPKCGKTVLLKRDRLDFCIALMLLIFTAGIGLIIYYFAREKNRCVHCNSYCQFQLPDTKPTLKNGESGEVKGLTIRYCQYCGVEINQNTASCPNCGSSI